MTDPHAPQPGEKPPFQPREQQDEAMKRRYDSTAQGGLANPLMIAAAAAAVAVVILLIVILAS